MKIHKKMVAIGVGVAMGVSMSISPMAPARHAEAAIAVIDEKNIAEAIEMVNNAVKILTEAQKQYLLLVANTKKLDIGALTEFLGIQDENLKFLNDLYKDYKGIMQSAKKIEQIWKDTVGDIEALKSGKMTVFDLYKIEQNRVSQAESTIKDAGNTISNIQEINTKVMERNKKIAEQTQKVEGLHQAVQTGIEATVNSNDALVGVSTGIVTLLSINVQEYMEHQAERVRGEATRDMQIDQGRQEAASYDGTKNLHVQRLPARK